MQVSTTLVSMTDEAMVRANCNAVLLPLTDKEQEVKAYIEERFFKPLKIRHWEGKEVEEYWDNIKSVST